MIFNPLPDLLEQFLANAYMAFPLVGPFLGTLGAFYFQGWRSRQTESRTEYTSAEYAFFVLQSHHNILVHVWENQLEAHSKAEDRHLSLKNLHFESEVMPIDFPSLRFILNSHMPEVMAILFEADHSFVGFIHTLKRRNDEYFRLREETAQKKNPQALIEVTESLYKAHESAVHANQKALKALEFFLKSGFNDV
tara:strand:+ start:246 stop:827 length:582 start_codon:yes stop_codon:yes gene_type:complete